MFGGCVLLTACGAFPSFNAAIRLAGRAGMGQPGRVRNAVRLALVPWALGYGDPLHP